MKTMKYSRQRESIKNFLSTRKDHPTADAVYMNIRKEYPNISLGTVYRNLSLLASVGEIQKIIELNFSLPGNIDVPVVQQKYSHICSCTTFGTGCDQSQRCPLTVCELYQIDTSQ